MTRTFIIAEAGVNHNGSLGKAELLVDVAADAGADAVKFQSFKAENVVTPQASKAAYQVETTGGGQSQLEMLQGLELSMLDHEKLAAHCSDRGIQFLSTPFDLPSVDFLGHELDMPMFKIASGEITNAPMMMKIASFGRPIIMSTGMSDLDDIRSALGVVAHGLTGAREQPSADAFRRSLESKEGRESLEAHVTLLQCTTAYPTPFADINLRAMDLLEASFGLAVGLSDHSIGTSIPIAAVARGARIIEKHFTLDRSLPGPDHQASLEPDELVAMVDGIRSVETALGDGSKSPRASEVVNQDVARRSLVAATSIKKGDVFDDANLTTKRPGTGISSILYYDWLGTTSGADYHEGELIH